jgi:hypothetical protein
MRSFPLPACITSRPAVPTIVSLPGVPTMVASKTKHLAAAACVVPLPRNHTEHTNTATVARTALPCRQTHFHVRPRSSSASAQQRRGPVCRLGPAAIANEAGASHTPSHSSGGSVRLSFNSRSCFPVVGAEVVRERVVERLAVPTPECEVDRGRVGALAVLVVTDRSVHGVTRE